MKKYIQGVLLIALSIILIGSSGCKKQELAETKTPKVVVLNIQGTKGVKDTLEFVKNNIVIAQIGNENQSFLIEGIKVSADENADIIVRRKGHAEILATRTISADLLKQTISCYYDGEKVYGNTVKLKVKGYAITGTLELLLDGKVIGSGTGSELTKTLDLGIDDGKNRQVQIRKKDENTPLLNKEIVANEPAQSLVFYYDGTKIFDKIDVGVPVNPANMLLSVKFTSKYDALFRAPADLMILKGKDGDDVYTQIGVIELSSDGSFSKAIELPSLAAEPRYTYSVKIVKRGTADELPYDLTNTATPLKPGAGRFRVDYTAGSSSMLVITDEVTQTTTGPPTRRGTQISLNKTDIGQYFK
ncbi:hypothetical protein [Pedobacter caeni]|uniref:Uncharacterized protein n=1 Tax=Pedobacter caeni TaxID=288992 RepID=A0A1M5G6D5_9SPHI|nr:hypothetical protein [Pedobacter caeni]SHF99315.1 hypothetical protein SAMN04488522_10479 [Pedobacter caeni]